MEDLKRVFRGTFSHDEVWAYIDGAVKSNPGMVVKGIAVSNSLHQRGISGIYRGVRIAVDRDQWPDYVVRVAFNPK